jgi:hypothetical protein
MRRSSARLFARACCAFIFSSQEKSTKKGAGGSGKEKIVSVEHAITDLIARGRKSQANATRDGL